MLWYDPNILSCVVAFECSAAERRDYEVIWGGCQHFAANIFRNIDPVQNAPAFKHSSVGAMMTILRIALVENQGVKTIWRDFATVTRRNVAPAEMFPARYVWLLMRKFP